MYDQFFANFTFGKFVNYEFVFVEESRLIICPISSFYINSWSTMSMQLKSMWCLQN